MIETKKIRRLTHTAERAAKTDRTKQLISSGNMLTALSVMTIAQLLHAGRKPPTRLVQIWLHEEAKRTGLQTGAFSVSWICAADPAGQPTGESPLSPIQRAALSSQTAMTFENSDLC